jgi:cellulose synthase/poly-beta-1,6-N-acetylglucosamine synthase-like glycosyltransferase
MDGIKFLFQIFRDLVYYSSLSLFNKLLCLLSISNQEKHIQFAHKQIQIDCQALLIQKTLGEKDIKISIIIPSYNEEQHLSKTLEHIFRREEVTPGLIEIILSDGGSRDETLSIVEKFQMKYPKMIKVIRGLVDDCRLCLIATP